MNTTHRKALRRPTVVLLAAALAGQLAVSTAHAQVGAPKLINYQGRLTGGTGQPLPDGLYAVKFELFNKKDSSQSGDTRIWGRTYSNIAVVDGHFNVVLGAAGGTAVSGSAVNDIGFAFADPERYLQMTIQSGPSGISYPQVLQPRQQLVSVPYAMNGVPTGTILPFGGGTNPPPGFLMCDGTRYRTSDYPGLFEVIGVSFGSGTTASGYFRVPDLRGQFLRGVSYASNRDPDKNSRTTQYAPGYPNVANEVGSLQYDATARPNTAFTYSGSTSSTGGHSHKITGPYSSSEGGDGKVSVLTDDQNFGTLTFPIKTDTAPSHYHTYSGSISSGGDAETRPPNIYVNFIIKY